MVWEGWRREASLYPDYVGSRLEIHLKGKEYTKAVLFMALMTCSSLTSALEVDISKMQSAEMKTVDWMGYPVHIYKRSAEQTENLQKLSLNHPGFFGGHFV